MEDLEQDIRDHIAIETQDKIDRGMSRTTPDQRVCANLAA
jgi:hypothetical protein